MSRIVGVSGVYQLANCSLSLDVSRAETLLSEAARLHDRQAP